MDTVISLMKRLRSLYAKNLGGNVLYAGSQNATMEENFLCIIQIMTAVACVEASSVDLFHCVPDAMPKPISIVFIGIHL